MGTVGSTVGVGDGIVVLAAELFEGLASSLRDEKGGKATEQHEKSVNLQDVVHPRVWGVSGGAAGSEGGNGTLANDGADFARGSRDTV